MNKTCRINGMLQGTWDSLPCLDHENRKEPVSFDRLLDVPIHTATLLL